MTQDLGRSIGGAVVPGAHHLSTGELPKAALGRSGRAVSRIGFGSTGVGAEPLRHDRATVDRMVGAYLDRGGNLFDAADSYHGGWSEAVLGRVLRRRRDDVVLTSKVGMPVGPGPHDAGLAPERIAPALEASLRRLGTDHVDLYQVHLYDDDVPLAETMAALDALVRSGKVRALGASSFRAWQLAEADALAAAHGWARFDSVQLMYNLIRRDADHELLAYCASHEVAVLVYSPLQGGVLAGAMGTDRQPLPGSRLASPHMRSIYLGDDEERALSIAETVAKVAARRAVAPSQVALAWVLERPGVTSALIGPESPPELDEDLGGAHLVLDHAERAALDAASARTLPYPADFYARRDATFADMRARAAQAGPPPTDPQTDHG